MRGQNTQNVESNRNCRVILRKISAYARSSLPSNLRSRTRCNSRSRYCYKLRCLGGVVGAARAMKPNRHQSTRERRHTRRPYNYSRTYNLKIENLHCLISTCLALSFSAPPLQWSFLMVGSLTTTLSTLDQSACMWLHQFCKKMWYDQSNGK